VDAWTIGSNAKKMPNDLVGKHGVDHRL
jgi:hypothetical protein